MGKGTSVGGGTSTGMAPIRWGGTSTEIRTSTYIVFYTLL